MRIFPEASSQTAMFLTVPPPSVRSRNPANSLPSGENKTGPLSFQPPGFRRPPGSPAGANNSIPVRTWYTFPARTAHRPHGENGDLGKYRLPDTAKRTSLRPVVMSLNAGAVRLLCEFENSHYLPLMISHLGKASRSSIRPASVTSVRLRRRFVSCLSSLSSFSPVSVTSVRPR